MKYGGKYMYIVTYIYALFGLCIKFYYSNWLQAGLSGIESRWRRDFLPVQIGPGAHPASFKMGTGSFPGGKVRPGACCWPLTPGAAVMEEYSYTSTHPLGHIGPVTGSLYLFLLNFVFSTCSLNFAEDAHTAYHVKALIIRPNTTYKSSTIVFIVHCNTFRLSISAISL
jgi:hypothetical protein